MLKKKRRTCVCVCVCVYACVAKVNLYKFDAFDLVTASILSELLIHLFDLACYMNIATKFNCKICLVNYFFSFLHAISQYFSPILHTLSQSKTLIIKIFLNRPSLTFIFYGLYSIFKYMKMKFSRTFLQKTTFRPHKLIFQSK